MQSASRSAEPASKRRLKLPEDFFSVWVILNADDEVHKLEQAKAGHHQFSHRPVPDHFGVDVVTGERDAQAASWR